ncbi:MAG: hypothetical protein KME12_26380 [Trichocoleus desertorum ATA4-8-CV12]|jgi:hypothetical protein|nr:hypothetical protein [Trichocoleus desertorum ATA4-8-CV12]
MNLAKAGSDRIVDCEKSIAYMGRASSLTLGQLTIIEYQQARNEPSVTRDEVKIQTYSRETRSQPTQKTVDEDPDESQKCRKITLGGTAPVSLAIARAIALRIGAKWEPNSHSPSNSVLAQE